MFEGAVEPWNPKLIPKLKTLNVECGMCLKVQYKHETPKLIPKLKTLNVECGMCLKVQWNHEIPNQSLNLKP